VKGIRSKKGSIVHKITRLILGIIVLQTLLFSGILIVGGVIYQAEKNAYQAFHDKVNSRKAYLQSEMKNSWTNYDPYIGNIRKLLSAHGSDTKSFFREAVTQMIPMLRATQATGVFIIIKPNENGNKGFPAVYLRDYDPMMNPYSNDDIYMVCGSPELAEVLMIPMDQTWQYRFHPTEGSDLFINKPYEAATVASTATLLGYWSKPFTLNEHDIPIITYSIPLFDNSGKLRGVVGTELTLNHLAKFFPAQELQPRDSLGYFIASSDEKNEEKVPLIMGGALQRRFIRETEPLKLSIVDEEEHIYTIENHAGKESLYAAVEELGLYKFNTPFENEHWYLIGIMRKDYLLSYANRIRQIIFISLLLSIVIGTVGGALISFQMTKPIVVLARQVRDIDLQHELQFMPTGLQELDELSRSVEITNHRMLESASRLTKIIEMLGLPIGAFEMNPAMGKVFVTEYFWDIISIDKKEAPLYENQQMFTELLDHLFSKPDSTETDVYAIGETPTRWIRYKESRNNGIIVGVVMDVTGEIQEKKQIQRERDHDPLTSLLNRKGFQWEFERWRETSSGSIAALVMFDLDNLKQVNDNFGHKWGDQYIVTAVEQLKGIAPKENQILGRRSGDEFILLLHGFESEERIRRCMESFYEGLSARLVAFPNGKSAPVSISAGLMWVKSEQFSYDELLHFADEALYIAKGTKKGTYIENTTFPGSDRNVIA